MKNRVKIIDFLTLLRITRKLIITEQCTKNFKDLVLSYEFTKKKLLKSVKKKWATARRSSPIGPPMTGGGGAVLQCRSMQIYWLYF